MTLMNRFYENFVAPPEAPTCTPTDEEFKDPLAYIAKIKPYGEKYGIIKIKPPSTWNPPFAIDVKNFLFTPRLQKLNELEALSRIRLNFLDSLARFWMLQGIQMKIPVVDNKLLDLFQLRKAVQEYGGFELCCNQRRWTEIAKRLGAKPIRAPVLRDHYEKIIAPYDLHENGIAAEHAKGSKTALKLNSKMRSTCPLRMRSRMMQCMKEVQELKKELFVDVSPTTTSAIPLSRKQSRELKNLQFYGDPGPKSLTTTLDSSDGRGIKVKNEPSEQGTSSSPDQSPKPKGKQEHQIDLVFCKFCCKGDDEHCLLLCDTCDHSFHTYCLLPPLNSVPKGDWRCPKCITEEVKKPPAAYGFAQAERVYTLHSFGEMADRFKSEYFGMPAHLVPCSTVEKEFWRLVISEGDGLTVEYGADLLTDDVGSGFPRCTDKNLDAESQIYAESPWNLNNLPILSNSVLSHITVDISGMKVPWVYVGMCFSTFCWHTEDHWSYSINYLHWGEPKTWYAVSGLEADQFETCMKDVAPELFSSQADLLHHLVTLANPRLLMERGVRIYTVNQCAGEFVITFPRAYHAGFNQGYNFAEAVNFCPPDWLSAGRRCVDHYSDLCRPCVFSHDELIVAVATTNDQLDVRVASAARDDFCAMVDRERRLTLKFWLKVDVNHATSDHATHQAMKRVIFESIPDEERQCVVCATTCYLSAVTCQCSPTIYACLKHFESLCFKCQPKDLTLNYRFDASELEAMLEKLNTRVTKFDRWCKNVKSALEAKLQDRLSYQEFKSLASEAELNAYPWNELRKSVKNSLKQVEKCSSVADQLVAQKINASKQISANGRSNYSRKLRFEEVEVFAKNLDKLCCELDQAKAIHLFIDQVHEYKRECAEFLSSNSCRTKEMDGSYPNLEATLNTMLNKAIAFDLQLPEIPKIKAALSTLIKTSDETNSTSGITPKIEPACQLESNKRIKLELPIDDSIIGPSTSDCSETSHGSLPNIDQLETKSILVNSAHDSPDGMSDSTVSSDNTSAAIPDFSDKATSLPFNNDNTLGGKQEGSPIDPELGRFAPPSSSIKFDTLTAMSNA